jgi:Tfp pilus assembly pilus retraction ATPase PilT
MVTMDNSLADLVRRGLISLDVAASYARDSKNFETLLNY